MRRYTRAHAGGCRVAHRPRHRPGARDGHQRSHRGA